MECLAISLPHYESLQERYTNFMNQPNIRHFVGVTSFKRQPVMSQAERLAVVAACRYVDEVVEEGPRIITPEFMQQKGYAIYAFACCGTEEVVTKRRDCPDLPDHMLGILSYTDGVSTTGLIQRVQQRLQQAETSLERHDLSHV